MKMSMYTSIKSILAVGAVLALGACAGNWDIPAVKAMTDKGSAFQVALHKEYVALAQGERDEADWTDAAFFNGLAFDAATGKAFGPQEINARTLPKDMVTPLTTARNSLVAALPAGSTQKPAIAARAQAMFDCWMQEQEENFQPEDIAKCRAEFETALAQLGATPMKPAAKAAPAPTFTVFFGFNNAALDSAAQTVVKDAAAFAAKKPTTLIVLKGHADRSGDTAYNVALSERRSEATAQALLDAGVSAKRIHREGHGEYDPAVSTDDGVAEAKNRRVTITFSK